MRFSTHKRRSRSLGRIDPTYQAWINMIRRCNNPKMENYPHYGGRGIRVCERWLRFENFLADMGDRPDGLSLDRENNDGNYEPGNCRWADAFQQCNNKQRNRLIELGGRTQTVAQWVRELGLKRCTVEARLHRGWDGPCALTEPLKWGGRNVKR